MEWMIGLIIAVVLIDNLRGGDDMPRKPTDMGAWEDDPEWQHLARRPDDE